MFRTVLPLLLALVLPAGAGAQIKAPPAGATVDDRQIVDLPTTLPSRCIALTTSGASVILSRDDIESAANMALAEHWVTEEDRQKLIRQNRAKALLQGLSGVTDANGCATTTGAQAGDAIYLFSHAIDHRNAVVVSSETGKPVDHVIVQFTAQAGVNGTVSYSLPDDRVFLMLGWWVS